MRGWLRAALLSGLALSLPLPGAAQEQTVSGVVRERAPLAGVTVQAELDGRALASSSTDNNGEFSIQLGTSATAASDLVLSFTKTGLRQENRFLKVGAATMKPLDIVLLPLSGTGVPSEADRKLLDPRRTTVGTGPLMFVPYVFVADTAPSNTDELNLRLRVQIQRLIQTHVQTALTDADARSVSLTPLNVTAAEDLERLQTFGEYVNALAVVSGLGIGEGSGAAQKFELSSSFVIIPRTNTIEPPVLTIVDVVPAASLGKASLDQSISKEWGRATIIALALRDLKAAEPLSPTARRDVLKRVQRYLIAERANVGAKEHVAAAKLQELVDMVNKELEP